MENLFIYIAQVVFKTLFVAINKNSVQSVSVRF